MSDPISEHKQFLEELVRKTRSVSAHLVRKEGIFSKAKTDAELNALVERLAPDDRELLAQMLERCRIGGFHDTLVALTEACLLGGLRLVKNGEEIPVEPFGYTLFQEYITLLGDGHWSSLEG